MKHIKFIGLLILLLLYGNRDAEPTIHTTKVQKYVHDEYLDTDDDFFVSFTDLSHSNDDENQSYFKKKSKFRGVNIDALDLKIIYLSRIYNFEIFEKSIIGIRDIFYQSHLIAHLHLYHLF